MIGRCLPLLAVITLAEASSAQVNVERALTERNAALLEAANLRNNFVHHVSYELRSPLTAIIGFIEMLAEGTVGPLNERQRDYIRHIRQSSDALLAIAAGSVVAQTERRKLSAEHWFKTRSEMQALFVGAVTVPWAGWLMWKVSSQSSASVPQ